MTKRVDRPAEAGLVTKRRSDVDGRGRVVALTDKGRRLIDEALTDHVANEHRLLEALTERERDLLRGVLSKWLREFESGDSGGPLKVPVREAAYAGVGWACLMWALLLRAWVRVVGVGLA